MRETIMASPESKDFEIERYAKRASELIFEEFPTWSGQCLNSPEELSLPRSRHPLFWGCYDWHSCVHTHWALSAIWSYLKPDTQAEVEKALRKSLNKKDILGEQKAWENMSPYDFFERPYGITWFLELMAQIRRNSATAESLVWSELLHDMEGLEVVISKRAIGWLDNLSVPSRTGVHDQTAWSLLLLLDWAEESASDSTMRLVREKSLFLFGEDEDAPWRYEPDENSFLSPSLNEAMLMGKVMSSIDFESWLKRFMPSIEDAQWDGLPKVQVKDSKDFLQAHFVGLCLSRAIAWRAISHSLPEGPMKNHAKDLAIEEAASFSARTNSSYAVEHWVGSYEMAWLVDAFK